MNKKGKRTAVLAATAVLGATIGVVGSSSSAASQPHITFSMVRSAAAVKANCLNGATATVTDTSLGPVESLTITARHLPHNTDFDVFIIQLPNAPFGVSWYQGDLESNGSGVARGTFIGRFSVETFVVAPGSGQTPVVHTSLPFRDATSNPSFAPVHTYHVGFWFDSPSAAADAGCPATETPFNGDHTAGIQAMSTKQFPSTRGPLRALRP